MKKDEKNSDSEIDIEKATAFSHYGGSASAYESAVHLLMNEAKEYWAKGEEGAAVTLRRIATMFKTLGEQERTKQRETGYIKL